MKSNIESAWPISAVGANVRVICDNDYAGDPDGLIQLAHHLLSPSVEIVGIIGSRHWDDNWPADDSMTAKAIAEARMIAELCRRSDLRIVAASDDRLDDTATAVLTPGAAFIIEEALRDDARPLFVACGAGLGEVARAWLHAPNIAGRLTIVWIGGREHAPMPGAGIDSPEYNLGIDPIAAQVIFNQSDLDIWQFPRDVYRQAMASRTELMVRMGEVGALGAHLFERLGQYPRMFESISAERPDMPKRGETYCLGDSPLVLVTALLSMFDPEPSSCEWVERPCPGIDVEGRYVVNPMGRNIRVFTRLDNRLWLEDFYLKLQLLARA